MNTLAEALGETSHLSVLAHKLKRLELPLANDWRQLAVQRGCRHYQTDRPTVEDPGEDRLSNAELIVALLLGQNPDDLDLVRIAGQLLGGEFDLAELLALAKKERVERRLRYLADQACEIEPTNIFWKQLRARLPSQHYDAGQLPHKTRFAVPTRKPTPRSLRQPTLWQWLRPGS